MDKICCILLNYNLGKMTDSVYEELKPYIDEDIDIVVWDVSDKHNEVSKYVTHFPNDNYYGDNFKEALEENMTHVKKYDWFVLMSNDVYAFPKKNWLRELADSANEAEAHIVTPAFNEDSSHFEHMHKIPDSQFHFVNWVDFPCPMIHRRLIEPVLKEWTNMLKYGWGIDSLFGIYCYDKEIPIIVNDKIVIKHYREKTFKEEVDKLSTVQYCQRASQAEAVFFCDYCGSAFWIKWRDSIRNEIVSVVCE